MCKEQQSIIFSRKRVHFDSNNAAPIIKRQVLEWYPLCREMTFEEKQARWIQQEESHEIRMQAIEVARGAADFASTYAHVYALCQSDQTAPTVELVHHVARRASLRGLEDRILPSIGIERRMARTKAIRTILKAQSMCTEDDVGILSRILSQSATRMGQVLAVADARAAMVEYMDKLSPLECSAANNAAVTRAEPIVEEICQQPEISRAA